MRHTLRVFQRAAAGTGGVARFDVIIVARFDASWRRAITQWHTPGGYRGVRVLSGCVQPLESGTIVETPPETCADDVLFTTTGQDFGQFVAAMLSRSCFGRFDGQGHTCYEAFQTRFGKKHVQLLTKAREQTFVDDILSTCTGCAKAPNKYTCDLRHESEWMCDDGW